jgi:hypothetical protein
MKKGLVEIPHYKVIIPLKIGKLSPISAVTIENAENDRYEKLESKVNFLEKEIENLKLDFLIKKQFNKKYHNEKKLPIVETNPTESIKELEEHIQVYSTYVQKAFHELNERIEKLEKLQTRSQDV